MRRAARRDANHRAVIAAFEALGCSVVDVAGTPCGFDIIVGYGGTCLPIEIKDGAKPASARRLTPNEAKVHGKWTGGTRLVKDLGDVELTVKVLRKRAQILWNSALELTKAE